MTLTNIERNVNALLRKHETPCEYIERNGTGGTGTGKWFSCKCGASGMITETPHQAWMEHVTYIQTVLLPMLRRIQATLLEL